MAKVVSPPKYNEIGPVRHFGLDSEHGGTRSFRAAVHSLPPGKQTMPHYHDVESAVYMIKTGVVVFIGREQEPLRAKEGDFLYLEAKEIHSAYNPSKSETHVSLVIQAGSNDEEVGLYELPKLMPLGLAHLKKK